MSRTADPSQYIEQQTAAHVADLTQTAKAGWPFTLKLIGEAMCKLDSAAWDRMVIDTAKGENAMGEFIAKVIKAEAEARAIADANRVQPQTRPSRVIEQRAADRAWRGLCATEPGYP